MPYAQNGLLGNLSPVHFTERPLSRQSKAQSFTPCSSQRVKVRPLADRNDAVANSELFFVVVSGLRKSRVSAAREEKEKGKRKKKRGLTLCEVERLSQIATSAMPVG